MKTSACLLALATAALVYGGFPSSALAQKGGDKTAVDDTESGFPTESEFAAPALPTGHVARYRVTYMKSNTAATALRTATVVSITNQSSVSCGTSVDFKVGSSTVCTTSVTIAPGTTVDHCSRTIPSGITSCNATCSPSLTFDEGHAIVGSSSTTGCEKIAVSARTYYTSSTSDSPVSAVTDAKVVKLGVGNAGD